MPTYSVPRFEYRLNDFRCDPEIAGMQTGAHGFGRGSGAAGAPGRSQRRCQPAAAPVPGPTPTPPARRSAATLGWPNPSRPPDQQCIGGVAVEHHHGALFRRAQGCGGIELQAADADRFNRPSLQG